jgi:glycosyltransferase involved in cell wall biosynthesis
MKISIALATFNGGKYLQEQLDSFLNQNRLPDELVVCDDGSNDETLSILEGFSEKAPFPVKIYLNEKNLGYSQNFSKALALCEGDLIFLSDQDDVWLPDKINIVMQRFDERPEVQLIIHDLDYCKENMTPIGQTKIERMSGFFDLQKDYVVGMATAIRGDFLRLCLPIPDNREVGHDNWLHDCSNVVEGKAIIEDVLALHRRHVSNATASNGLNMDFVTDRNYFYRNVRLMSKTPIEYEAPSALYGWMQERKLLLSELGYVQLSCLNKKIEKQKFLVSSLKRRSSIHAAPRMSRLRLILSLYVDGGYAFFSGLRSAVKDLVGN